ncbi:MAG: alpha/beta hydrolase, partial [Anaerolineae bacterium]
AVNVPTTIITAQDDPIIPFADFAPLTEINPCVTLSVQPYGGHMGFVDLFPLRRWLTGAVAACLNQT